MKTAPLVVAMKHELEVPSGWGKGTAGRGDSPCESVRTPQFRAQTAGCWWERGGWRRWRPDTKSPLRRTERAGSVPPAVGAEEGVGAR